MEMKPDRTNYGLWVIDMLDGNLDEEGVMELMSFLSENPDLKDEYESFFPEKLVPGELEFGKKEKLHRGVADLDMSQIDLLSVAALEKEITPEQQSELDHCLKGNLEAGKRYNTIQKLKLVPGNEIFTNKRALQRAVLSPAANRAVIALTAAAAILVLLLSLPLFDQNKVDNGTTLAANGETNPAKTAEEQTMAETGLGSRKLEEKPPVQEVESLIQQVEPKNPEVGSQISKTESPLTGIVSQVPGEEFQIQEKESRYPVPPINGERRETAVPVLAANNPQYGEGSAKNLASIGSQEIITEEYTVYGYGIPQVEIDYSGTLLLVGIAPNAPDIVSNKVTVTPNMEFGEYGDRTIINKLIASAFRKRVLDQEIPTDDPIKGYEVAEAWVLTLNRLWETEMAFIKNTDENGDVESVYIDAGLVKFNSKVKKSGVEL